MWQDARAQARKQRISTARSRSYRLADKNTGAAWGAIRLREYKWVTDWYKNMLGQERSEKTKEAKEI
eukprot:750657-Hanusia_phi.AAC.3